MHTQKKYFVHEILENLPRVTLFGKHACNRYSVQVLHLLKSFTPKDSPKVKIRMKIMRQFDVIKAISY